MLKNCIGLSDIPGHDSFTYNNIVILNVTLRGSIGAKNSEYKRVVITTLKRRENSEYNRVVITTLKIANTIELLSQL